jgi:hypothetical protein
MLGPPVSMMDRNEVETTASGALVRTAALAFVRSVESGGARR